MEKGNSPNLLRAFAHISRGTLKSLILRTTAVCDFVFLLVLDNTSAAVLELEPNQEQLTL